MLMCACVLFCFAMLLCGFLSASFVAVRIFISFEARQSGWALAISFGEVCVLKICHFLFVRWAIYKTLFDPFGVGFFVFLLDFDDNNEHNSSSFDSIFTLCVRFFSVCRCYCFPIWNAIWLDKSALFLHVCSFVVRSYLFCCRIFVAQSKLASDQKKKKINGDGTGPRHSN